MMKENKNAVQRLVVKNVPLPQNKSAIENDAEDYLESKAGSELIKAIFGVTMLKRNTTTITSTDLKKAFERSGIAKTNLEFSDVVSFLKSESLTLECNFGRKWAHKTITINQIKVAGGEVNYKVDYFRHDM